MEAFAFCWSVHIVGIILCMFACVPPFVQLCEKVEPFFASLERKPEQTTKVLEDVDCLITVVSALNGSRLVWWASTTLLRELLGVQVRVAVAVSHSVAPNSKPSAGSATNATAASRRPNGEIKAVLPPTPGRPSTRRRRRFEDEVLLARRRRPRSRMVSTERARTEAADSARTEATKSDGLDVLRWAGLCYIIWAISV